MRLTLAITLAFAAAPAVAKDPILSPPLDCGAKGNGCIIQQYTDNDPSKGAADFMCGPLSYDGHKGTDFRVPTVADMEKGVTVLSAAPGTVVATRDGMPDINASAPNAPDTSNRECGNGLVIDHGGGWQTQYCHLREGSLAVAKGDRVAKGTNLGQIGLSGRTEFPHVHLSVRKNGKVVDPFNPDATNTCGAATRTLWQTPPQYVAGGLLDIGFHDAVPAFKQLKAGLPDPATMPVDAPALVLWAYIFAGKAGDQIKFDLDGPKGWELKDTVLLTKTQPELFRAVGKRQPTGGWPTGTFNGAVTILRDGAPISSDQVSVTLK